MKLEINRDGPTPLHTQAEMLLRRLIEQDEYKDGKLLPKETELSEQLGISRNTLRQAMNTIVLH